MVERRQFLQWLGTASAVAGAYSLGLVPGEYASAETAPEGGQAERQWCMVIDLKKCEGCETDDNGPGCIAACQREHFVPDGQQWMKVHKKNGAGGGTYFQPSPCMQCENAPCEKVCPVKATYHNPEGIVLIDHDRCIGCRFCIAACPYDARHFNWTQPEVPPEAFFAEYSPEYPVPQKKGTAIKCMFCAHHLRKGKLPACVQGCPMNAIYMGDLVSDMASNGAEVVQLSTLLAEGNATREKEKLGTRPRVFYLPGHGQEFGRAPR